jgi:hypothetical protein
MSEMYICIATADVVEVIGHAAGRVRYRMFGGEEREAAERWFRTWFRSVYDYRRQVCPKN